MTDAELLAALRALILHPPEESSAVEIVSAARTLLRASE